MQPLSEVEKSEMKLRLTKAINGFIEKETGKDNHKIGWMPDGIESMMATAAFSVLEAVNGTNHYMERENLILS